MDTLTPQEDTRMANGVARQTFLFSATLASDYDRYVSKEKLFGAKCDPKKIIECGDKGEDDEKFTMTVKGLAQKFALVPQNVKEAYLIQILKEHKLKKSQ